MADLTKAEAEYSDQNFNTSTPRKLKILMLHGYTQSGPLFHAKTRALEKHLQKNFPVEGERSSGNTSKPTNYPGGVQLIYPTAPLRLSTVDIPGMTSESVNSDEDIDRWAWWTRDKDSNMYVGLENGLATIARSIRENNGIDGVVGFSQGAAAAALVTSLLEPGRRQVFEQVYRANPHTLPFPEEWQELTELCPNGLKFAVAYSGFLPAHPAYQAFFEPKINTHILHVIGSLDSVLDESRSRALVEKCASDKKIVISHPGGHFVPNDKRMVNVLVAFIRNCLTDEEE